MKTQALSLLSLVGRAASGRAISIPAHAARVVACSSTSQPHAHASTHAHTHATRTITTKSKSRGPARVMTEGHRDDNQEFIVEPDIKDIPLPNTPAATYVFQDAAKWSHKTATECSITGRSYTYGQIVDGMMKFGGALQKLTSRKSTEGKTGPTVAILAPNCAEYPIAYFGTHVIGGTVTPMNPTYTPGEIAHHLGDSGAEIVVVDAMLEPLADAALKLLKKDLSVIVNGASKSGRPNLRDIIADPNTPFATHVEVPMDATAVLPYSSGTTGKPKGVCISHKALTSSLALFHHPSAGQVTPAEGEHQDAVMGLLPFFHIFGMMALMTSAMTNGAKLVTMPQFDPKVFLEVLVKHKVSRLQLVPPLINFLAMSPEVQPAMLSSINSILCGAAPVSTASAAMLKEKASQPIFIQEGFGMTETLCTHMTPVGHEKLGWCGKVMAHVRSKVVDLDTGMTLPPGEKGELCIDAPGMMTSYHNNPEATRDAFDSEGWFKTGDVAIYDEEGFFSIVDRMKELIKVKGVQVSPSELEDVIISYPGVADVGVIGVADEKAGEVPRAYVVPKGKDLKKDELNAFVAERVAPHKQLAGGIEFVEQLPKNPTGKLLRRELKKMAHGE